MTIYELMIGLWTFELSFKSSKESTETVSLLRTRYKLVEVG
jgi:1,4-alpha-glucan branching enzyme